MLDSVALVNYEGDVRKALEEGVELIGGFGVLKSPLIVKPNICTHVDKTGFAVTNVEVVEALVKLVLKVDESLSIKIVESDSESKFADEAFEKYFNNPKFPDIIVRSGYFVSLAVAKTHPLTFVTGALKNLFGLLPRKDQSFYHAHINDVIVDLNRFVRPDLCIVDARMGLEGWEGPKTRRIDVFIVGRKPASVDATMARVMGFEPEKIHHLAKAEKCELGTLDPKVLGKRLKSAKVKFSSPGDLSPNALLQ